MLGVEPLGLPWGLASIENGGVLGEVGRTWIFHLRRATWSDGEACDAHDFEFDFKRILNSAKRNTPVAIDVY